MVTTALTLPGYKIVRNCGVVRGITVRSRSIVGNFFGGLQSIFGGNISIYTNLCERARSETYQLMCEHAQQMGANAIISMRYDATELMAGLTEVLCYGTAVIVEADIVVATTTLQPEGISLVAASAVRNQSTPLYDKLLLACGGDAGKVARLIDFEKNRAPSIDEQEAIKRALSLL
jgi:uncharacterized protein YbjQ (UPF0145 family)